GEVLTPDAGVEVVAVELARPPGGVLRGVGVHGLPRPAVVLPVGLLVPGDLVVGDGDAVPDGALHDGRRDDAVALVEGTCAADVDGDDTAGGHGRLLDGEGAGSVAGQRARPAPTSSIDSDTGTPTSPMPASSSSAAVGPASAMRDDSAPTTS